jgi:hypothetical protein
MEQKITAIHFTFTFLRFSVDSFRGLGFCNDENGDHMFWVNTIDYLRLSSILDNDTTLFENLALCTLLKCFTFL